MSATERSATRVVLSRAGAVGNIQFVATEGVPIFSSHVLGELGNLLAEIAHDANLRFVTFTGTGGVFIAGGDIGEMVNFTEDRGTAFARHGQSVFEAIEGLPQVTFAAINGHALGGGCELATACDFRLMVTGATIGHPESRLGLTPGWGGTTRLRRLIGPGAARRLFYSGRALSADEAARIGLIDEVIPTRDTLEERLEAWYEEMAAGSPAAIARIKRAILEDDEVNQFGMCFSCSDAKEGMRAFLEKREPVWTSWADCGRVPIAEQPSS